MQWMRSVRQTAVIDESEQLAVRLVQAPFEPIRESYARIGFDAIAFAAGLAERAAQARTLRTRWLVAQNRRELFSTERDALVDEIGAWFHQLRSVARFAKTRGHALAEPLELASTVPTMSHETWSQTFDGLDAVQTLLSTLGTVGDVGLTPNFQARGAALRGRLVDQRTDAARWEAAALLASAQLGWTIGDIVTRFEVISAARDLVRATSGEDLPGLELALVKAAGPGAPPAVRAADRGRNLFNLPLRVLLDQAMDTRVHLEVMEPVRAAFSVAGFDLAKLEGELEAAIDQGHAAALRERLTDVATKSGILHQQRVNGAFRTWAGVLRLRKATDTDTTRPARTGVASRQGSRFSATLTALRLIVAELRRAGWRPELLAEGVGLLETADRLVSTMETTEVDRRGAAADARQARHGLRSALRSVRMAWKTAVASDPWLPEMPVGRLEAYTVRTKETSTVV